MPAGKKVASIRIVLMIIGLMLAFTPTAHAEHSKRFDFLLRFYDFNEASYAYYRHCLSSSESINPNFLKTVDLVANELLAEAGREDPRRNPEDIKKLILERRYSLQFKLDTVNVEKGCATRETQVAKNHYQEFSRYKPSEIHKFINEKSEISAE